MMCGRTLTQFTLVIALLLAAVGCDTTSTKREGEVASESEVAGKLEAQRGKVTGPHLIASATATCTTASNAAPTGELHMRTCKNIEGTLEVRGGVEINVRNLLVETETLVTSKDSTDCIAGGYNWAAGLGNTPACGTTFLENYVTYLVYDEDGAGNGTCGSSGNCDRIIIRYAASSASDDIWGIHVDGKFKTGSTQLKHSGTTWIIFANVPRKLDFDVWYCDWPSQNECEVGSTTYTLDWNSVYVNKLGETIPQWNSAILDIDIVGTLSGTTIKVYDSGH